MDTHPQPVLDASQPRSPRKEVRLHLPLRFHVSLHTLRLLMNQSISNVVKTALDHYFLHHPEAGSDRGLARDDSE